MENFQVIQPSSLLKPYVKHYWFLETDNISGVSQRIIPTGFISLIFHRGKRMFSSSENTLQARAFISRQSTEYSDLVQMGKVNMVCIVFQPYGAKAFFRLPMNDLKGQTIAIDELGLSGLKELDDKLLNTYNNNACVEQIESYLLKQLNITQEYNHKRMAAVMHAINLGQADTIKLAQISCLGYKQFKRVFTEYVGANPKDFLRVIRFQKALYMLQNQSDINFTRLAYECNYYDQSHLIKEFRLFSGYTPSEYISVCAPYSDYFS